MSSKIINTQQTKSGSYAMTALGFAFMFLMALLVLVTCTETGRRYADNFKDKIFSKKLKLKDFDVIMFMSPTCPHCMRTLDVIQKEGEINNLTIIDVLKDEGKKIAEQFGADKRPVPSFISRKTNRSAVGSIENVSQLIEALNFVKNQPKSSEEPITNQNPNDATDPIQKLEIVLFAREDCVWCAKSKEECDKAGILGSIKIIDVSTPEGQKIASELIPSAKGVPVWMSLSTKKVVNGYKPVSELLKELQ